MKTKYLRFYTSLHGLSDKATDGDDRGDLQDTKADLGFGGTADLGHPPIH